MKVISQGKTRTVNFQSTHEMLRSLGRAFGYEIWVQMITYSSCKKPFIFMWKLDDTIEIGFPGPKDKHTYFISVRGPSDSFMAFPNNPLLYFAPYDGGDI